jgi:hypothetical protein
MTGFVVVAESQADGLSKPKNDGFFVLLGMTAFRRAT